ncbi:MAG: hypothetical protein JNL02_13105 [Saprospiraceae bacterium]|nr:hypothetical protein [Saprospiraceae bacterium]
MKQPIVFSIMTKHWKKSDLFFWLQAIYYAQSWRHLRQILSYRKSWQLSFNLGRNSVSDERPWLTLKAQEIISSLIQPEYKVFEYGGGGSTLFLCQRVQQVVTVEDHEEWFSRLKHTIKEKGFSNWDGLFIRPEERKDNAIKSHTLPSDFISGAKGLQHLTYEKYARSIEAYPSGFFDLILVDGRARPSCIQCALPYLKPGGLLVVDNTERQYYLQPFQDLIKREFEIILNDRYPTLYTPDFTITTILRRKF